MRTMVLGLGMLVGMYGQQPAMEHMEHHAPGAVSESLKVTASGQVAMLSLAELQAMPQHSVTVHNGHNGAEETYTGVSLSDLLGKYGLAMTGDGARRVYRSYVRAEGTDGYFVVFSASELESALHTGDALVALTVDGKPLGQEGQMKLVLAGEKKPARWVRNLRALTIVTVD